MAKTRMTWAITSSTMALAAQWWMPRTKAPLATSRWMYPILSYAWSGDGEYHLARLELEESVVAGAMKDAPVLVESVAARQVRAVTVIDRE
jgi:hypothetical protein